ncbi:LytR/AlgR family response regulator transcription factor [Aureibacter tunicatorum]|uniref:Two-component system LytT family response regulator n=1 Tax=Aureibacter tunicatorum TaxID=866807 RepID=A0AAE3XI07_9BACT|nr:LytTR family transcriptional regulator DNA-binding domain-containing protein [Aureibacter tunicatorum]MDR6237213.1 two-component system LytT family response regulator [Aureibacter tunicatorum]BDD06205.1 DNA-binding response regulator [Aureibacter tunicatorum]
MKALIVDDERLARKELISLLSVHEQIEVVGEAINVDDAFEKIKQLKPEVIFLDIQMPGKTGFELLEMLDHVPKVIFVTAYDEYALKAFEVNAMDYLLKPVQPERLEECLSKLISNETNSELKEEDILDRSDKLTYNDQVFVKDGEKCWFVKLQNVRFFESDGNYVKVFFGENKPMIHRSLNALEERLDSRHFFRASRKYIVNLSWIENIETWFNGGLVVHLKTGEKIEVSRRQSTKFKELMSL